MCIKRRVSTGYHPQTDGSTERMNSTVEVYLRAFINWEQNDWAGLCLVAQIAITGRNAASTGVSPFFLQHGYDTDPIQLDEAWAAEQRHQVPNNQEKAAGELVEKFKESISYVQARMAEA
jgi:hypothetical protein